MIITNINQRTNDVDFWAKWLWGNLVLVGLEALDGNLLVDVDCCCWLYHVHAGVSSDVCDSYLLDVHASMC